MKRLHLFPLVALLALVSAELAQAGGFVSFRSRVVVERIEFRATIFRFRERIVVEEFRRPVHVVGFRQRVEVVDDYCGPAAFTARVVRSRVCH